MPQKLRGQTVWTSSRDARELNRIAQDGDVLWVAENIATNLAPWEAPQLASRYVVRRGRFGLPSVGGSWSPADLVHRYGKVWSEKPLHLRDMRGHGPQADGPFDDQPFDRPLDDVEIKGLEKRSREARELRRQDRSRRSRRI